MTGVQTCALPILVNNFGRFLGSNDLGPTADSAHYLRILPWYALPALPLAMWALWRARSKGLTTPPYALPLLGFVVIFAVLSVSADARELYALPMLIPLALLVGMVCGAMWASIAGLQKAYRNVHEVISTIMLNSIAAGIVDYLITGPLKEPDAFGSRQNLSLATRSGDTGRVGSQRNRTPC